MKAITVEPRRSRTTQLEEVEEPDLGDGSVLVQAVAVGEQDRQVEGKYGKTGCPHAVYRA
jgi:hypothetical protein